MLLKKKPLTDQKVDFGKKNNGKTTGFNVVAQNAGKEYGSPAVGQKVAGAIFQKMKAKTMAKKAATALASKK